MKNLFWELSLAGLLHDVGKLGQRAFPSGKGFLPECLALKDYICKYNRDGDYWSHLHTLYSCVFCDEVEKSVPHDLSLDWNLVRNLAIYHHRPGDDNQNLVHQADILSSAMERIDDGSHSSVGDFRKIGLMPIVNGILINNHEHFDENYTHRLEAFTDRAGVLFPEPELERKDQTASYRKLWDDLLEAWRLNKVTDPWGYINRGLSILESYTWPVPSATNVRPDISLFDHLKTTSAIAGCLYAADNSEKPFLLVSGDHSGIQKYIYDLRHGSGGLAKSLRGRSFSVGLFSDSVAFHILHESGCPLTHRILYASGHFYLLLPNNNKVIELLTETESKLDYWCAKKRDAEIRFSLGWVELLKDNIKTFSEAKDSVDFELQRKKDSPLSGVLFSSGWDENEFLLSPLQKSSETEEICASCQKRMGIIEQDVRGKKVQICEICHNDREFGENLVKNSQLTLEKLIGDDLGEMLPFSKADFKVNGGYLVMELEGNANISGKLPAVAQRKALYVPIKPDGGIKTFDEIARAAEGRKALGYLKADVDNLGYIFSHGLKQEEESISRFATLSRSIDNFFSAYFNELMKTEFTDIYTVYAGGDDLMVLGPWDKIFDLAIMLRKEFTRYTCGNPVWRLSAGIALTVPKTPVLSAVEAADEQLELSKNRREKNKKPEKNKKIIKNALTAFNETMDWEEAETAINQGKRLIGWMQDGTLNSGKVWRLFIYSRMYQDYIRTNDTTNLRYIPQLIYDLKRNWGDKTDGEQEAKRWAKSLEDPSGEEIRKLSFICQYALYGVRKREGAEND